jgi:hypothetical protein
MGVWEVKFMRGASVALLTVIVFSSNADAYIGPGLGAGALGVVLGVLASVILAVFAIVWYPLKRFLKKMKTFSQSKNNSRQTMGSE